MKRNLNLFQFKIHMVVDFSAINQATNSLFPKDINIQNGMTCSVACGEV